MVPFCWNRENKGLDVWAASVLQYGGLVPWSSAADVCKTIDAIQDGDAPWKTYSFCYQGPLPPTPPQWMTHTYELCVCDTHQVLHQQFSNPEFKDKINYTPYRQSNKAGKHVWSNFMSGDWAWKQAVGLNHPTTSTNVNTKLGFSRTLLQNILILEVQYSYQ